MFEHLDTGCLVMTSSRTILRASLSHSPSQQIGEMVELHSISRSFSILDHRKHQYPSMNLPLLALELDILFASFSLSQLVSSSNMLAKMILSGTPLKFVPSFRRECFELLQYVHRRVTRSQVPFTVKRTDLQCRFCSCSGDHCCFCHFSQDYRNTGWIQRTSVQKTESEKTCNLAVSMPPIGSSKNR